MANVVCMHVQSYFAIQKKTTKKLKQKKTTTKKKKKSLTYLYLDYLLRKENIGFGNINQM